MNKQLRKGEKTTVKIVFDFTTMGLALEFHLTPRLTPILDR